MVNFHVKRGSTRATYCLDLPKKDHLLALVKHCASSINLPFGFVPVHQKDTYNKEIGRTLSLSRVKVTPFVFGNIDNRNGRFVFHFSTPINYFNNGHRNYKGNVTLGLSIVQNSENVHLEYIVQQLE